MTDLKIVDLELHEFTKLKDFLFQYTWVMDDLSIYGTLSIKFYNSIGDKKVIAEIPFYEEFKRYLKANDREDLLTLLDSKDLNNRM